MSRAGFKSESVGDFVAVSDAPEVRGYASSMRNVRTLITMVATGLLVLGVLITVVVITDINNGSSHTALFVLVGPLLIGIGIVLFVVLTKDPTRNQPGSKAPTSQSDRSHALVFTVGEHEQHVVAFFWDQVWGWITITVDGNLIEKKLVTLSFRLVRVSEFEVGENEKHLVRIEKRRTLFASFAQPQPIRGFVDGVLVAENDGVALT